MSDSDSDSDCNMEWFHTTHFKTRRDTIVTFRPTEEVFEKFALIPAETKKLAVLRMKVCAFWLPALLQPESVHKAYVWAIDIGLREQSRDLCLDNLAVIHVVDSIFESLEKAALKKGLIRKIIIISNNFNLLSPTVLQEAIDYLEKMGRVDRKDLEMFHTDCMRRNVLHMIFTQFAKFIQDLGSDLERTMRSLTHRPSDHLIERSEGMKKRGNKHFQDQEYNDALRFYTEAIHYHPENHLLYGNRALCYIRCKRFLKAAGDGMCATLIKPQWAKGHYRYADALFYLGQPQMAFTANSRGRKLCKDDLDGMRDLEQQQQKFLDELIKADVLTRSCSMSSSCTGHVKGGVTRQAGEASKKKPAQKASEVKVDKQPAKNEKTAQKQGNAKEPKPSKSEQTSNDTKAELSNAAKKKAKTKETPAGDKNQTDGKNEVCEKLRSAVQDAHAALVDLRSRNAEQAFSQALALLETTTPKEVGLSTVDLLLLMFGRASALTEIGQPEELTEAQKVLQKMKSYEDRTFQCLVYYASGRVFFRENRFTRALEQFSNSLQMVKNQITPGKLTWPFTKEVVKETETQYFKEILERNIESCRFPPAPDAICRLEKCLSSVKAEIFLTDPDFKGFIQMCCCQSCTVEFHMACWKSLKSSVYNDKNEKDFLQEPCLTPDCVGLICSIKIYGPTGLVKCKFEAAILKPQTTKKPKVNQKCTSQKKLKAKEERKTKRKQNKQSHEEKQSFHEEILPQNEDSASQSQQKAWLLYRDRVLLQISQKLELLREEKSLDISALTSSLKPWLELDSSRGNRIAARILDWRQEQLHTAGQTVELLLERKNRVWARVFVHHLSLCVDLNPKLSAWACQLNNAGLEAARVFIERHADHLEQLDLGVLLNFAPLQEMIIEKLGARPELFSSIGLSVTEYLRQARPHDMRLFVWTLEEHREDYVSCHALLDEYFDMMDGHCSVLKKSDENNSPMKTKNRGRKKKQRDQRGVYVLPEARSVTPRDEWGQDFIDEDSLSFLHPDAFVVPSHLRGQVADFEDQYNSSRHRSHLKTILDNSPDETKESLYDYFAQILDEHGPLLAEDPLLVGELLYFPLAARQKIEQSGGFEAFLLDSLRFVKIGQRIGLARHAVALQHSVQGAILDDLDEITDPDDDSFTGFQLDNDVDFASNLDYYCPANVSRVLPNPYAPEFKPAGTGNYMPWSNGDNQTVYYVSPYQYQEADLYTCDSAGEVVDSDLAADRRCLKVDAAVQTCQEAMSSVAVNTEVYEPFEKYQGDVMKKEKSNMKLERDIQKMTDDFNKVSSAKAEDVVSLEADIEKINANIQVTNKELVLFQQKLEEEVKKDQKEKKANQETLKTLKQEIDELLQEQGSLTRSNREKKASYETKLSDFSDFGNQSATEKMNLEDEIKKSKESLTSATQECLSAQLLVMENSRDESLYVLRRELADSKALLSKLDEALTRFPNKDLEITRNGCKTTVEELKKKISNTEQEYQAQIDEVKTGSRVNELPPVNFQNRPEAAAAPLSAAAQASGSTPPPPAASAQHPAAAAAHRPAARTVDPPSHNTVFDKAMDSLASMFPDYSRSHLMKFVQELRSSTGGSLSSMALQDVVSGAAQLILDHQERLGAARSNPAAQRGQAATPPLLTPVWQAVPQQKAVNTIALNIEDPCIICHEDMNPGDIRVLECRHSFHHECIKSWLKEQSTCPTCRNHALLNDDFPVLIGRRRQAQ